MEAPTLSLWSQFHLSSWPHHLPLAVQPKNSCPQISSILYLPHLPREISITPCVAVETPCKQPSRVLHPQLSSLLTSSPSRQRHSEQRMGGPRQPPTQPCRSRAATGTWLRRRPWSPWQVAGGAAGTWPPEAVVPQPVLAIKPGTAGGVLPRGSCQPSPARKEEENLPPTTALGNVLSLSGEAKY